MGTLSELAAVVNLQEAHALEELVALESEWSGLWSRCPEATPFQSPDWLIPLSTQVSGGDLCVLAMRHQGRLIGLAPFLFRTIDQGRHLVLLGTGVTDYLDVLFEPAFADECGAALLCWLADNRDKWDACDWQQLRSGSTLLAYETPPEWTSQINVQEVCPVLSLPEQIRELPRTGPLRMLEKLRNYRRRLRKLGSDPDRAGAR